MYHQREEMNINFKAYANLYKDTLLNNIIPFWENNSIDHKYGGYFTCLDRTGKVYDTDKFMWLQARQIWTFAMLYNEVEQKKEWLDIAAHGIQFLKKYGRDKEGSFYFSLTRDGQALTHAFNIYSDCFSALAFGEFAKATQDEACKRIAIETYQRFITRQANPKGKFEKRTEARPMRSFGLPMMTAFLTTELEAFIESEKQQTIYDQCIHQILHHHYNPTTKVIHENVGMDGAFLDNFDGRLINPGHSIEAMWFLTKVAEKRKDKNLIERLTDICLQLLEFGWDKEYGGIFYFMDCKGAPLQQLEWDQKLWWVHQEALIALSKAYVYTQRADVWAWYERVHEYSWKHFHDPQYGEWFGYLNRQGQPHITLKGGKWKGCFHTPRFMYECWMSFDTL